MRKNSIKNTRINGEVQRELSRIISREIKDPRIAPMTSVVDAVVTSDLKQCKAYISVLGDQKAKEDTLNGLRSAVGYILQGAGHIPLILGIPRKSLLFWMIPLNMVLKCQKKLNELKQIGEAL